MKSSFGWAAKACNDFDLNETTFLNLDIKYVDMSTTARLATTAIGTQQVKIIIDPIIVGIGFRL